MAGFDTHNYCMRCRNKGKGQDPCVEKPESDCNFCNVLTSDQKSQLSTPSYKIKKEKWDSKKTAIPSKEPTSSDTLSLTLVDLALVLVVGVVDCQDTVKSPILSAPAEKRKKVEKDKASTSNSAKSTENPTKSSEHRLTKCTDPDQSLSEEQTYRGTIRGIRS